MRGDNQFGCIRMRLEISGHVQHMRNAYSRNTKAQDIEEYVVSECRDGD